MPPEIPRAEHSSQTPHPAPLGVGGGRPNISLAEKWDTSPFPPSPPARAGCRAQTLQAGSPGSWVGLLKSCRSPLRIAGCKRCSEPGAAPSPAVSPVQAPAVRKERKHSPAHHPLPLQDPFAPSELSRSGGGDPGLRCAAPACSVLRPLSVPRHSCN